MSFLPLFLLLLPVVLPHHAHASIRVELPKYVRGRIHVASMSSPIVQIASRSPAILSRTEHLLDFFSALSEEVDHSLAVNRGLRNDSSSRVFATCNNRSAKWRTGASNYMHNRGWTRPDSNCSTDVFGVPANLASQFSPIDLHRATVQRGIAINASAIDMASLAVRNWTHAEHGVRHRFNRGALACDLDHNAAFRLKSKWYLATGVTNAPSSAWLRDYERAYVDEYLHKGEDGKWIAARMTLPIAGGDGKEATDEATTCVVRWKGAAQPSQFGPLQVDLNLAVRDAVEKGQLFVQQAQDATTASNIAILALPLALNFVPIALVADVTRGVLLVYALLTDVLTVLPMGIKGVELLTIADRRFESVVTRMSDPNKENESVAAEMWVAECRTLEDVRPVGVAFVAVATVMMVVGIVLEVIARIVVWHETPWIRRNIWDYEKDQFWDADGITEECLEVRIGKDYVDDMR